MTKLTYTVYGDYLRHPTGYHPRRSACILHSADFPSTKKQYRATLDRQESPHHYSHTKATVISIEDARTCAEVPLAACHSFRLIWPGRFIPSNNPGTTCLPCPLAAKFPLPGPEIPFDISKGRYLQLQSRPVSELRPGLLFEIRTRLTER